MIVFVFAIALMMVTGCNTSSVTSCTDTRSETGFSETVTGNGASSDSEEGEGEITTGNGTTTVWGSAANASEPEPSELPGQNGDSSREKNSPPVENLGAFMEHWGWIYTDRKHDQNRSEWDLNFNFKKEGVGRFQIHPEHAGLEFSPGNGPFESQTLDLAMVTVKVTFPDGKAHEMSSVVVDFIRDTAKKY